MARNPEAELLVAILASEQATDQVMAAYFRAHPTFGSRERRAIVDTVYGCLRNLRTLGHALDQLERSDWSLTFKEACDRIEAWRSGRVSTSLVPSAVAANLPDWLFGALVNLLGKEETEALAKALHQPAFLEVRVNGLRVKREEAICLLRAEGIEAVPTPWSSAGLRLPAKTFLEGSEVYQRGIVEIQEEGSQLIAPLLGARRHETIVDFCAGAGGKTLHLGVQMANTGTLYALDPDQKRLDQLRIRAKRAGLSNVHTVRTSPLVPISLQADRVLVDAPCTGTGTLRRNPDRTWRYHDLAKIILDQKKILESAAMLVRPGGHLLYATCSLLTDENEAIIENFLADQQKFSFSPFSARALPVGLPEKDDRPLRLYPHRHGVDGFFAALLVRTNDN
ncbi:16S rRNA (cytosine967-C5)-methyltransferase [Gammaproteobacteria bacterium]